MQLLAIDPGPVQSAYIIIDTGCRPIAHSKVPNGELLYLIRWEANRYQRAVIEMIASYGMPVGAEVFETCVWIGRYVEAMTRLSREPGRVTRLQVKTHLCHSAKATDANVRQALVDRFAPGQPNHGKGTKAQPGWFYGFHSDIWAAYALAVYAADHPEP